jgi:hypothetical protein
MVTGPLGVPAAESTRTKAVWRAPYWTTDRDNLTAVAVDAGVVYSSHAAFVNAGARATEPRRTDVRPNTDTPDVTRENDLRN